MKKIRQSETVEIMRSQIRLNPYNPKRHSDKAVSEQKKNLQRVGYLGGVTWNAISGNLIDGHRRIKALDLINKYDGTSGKDYPVKVEKVTFDKRQEKEQMTYMALGNTKADYELIAEYLPDIDYTAAGIDEYDLSQIQSFLPDAPVSVEAIDDFIQPVEDKQPDTPPEPTAAEKAAVKEAKAAAKERAVENYQALTSYITISFKDADEKRVFCELAGISESEMFIQGGQVLDLIE